MKLIDRELYLSALSDLKDTNLIKILTGIRRAGKSTILETFAKQLPSQFSTITYNFEDPKYNKYLDDWHKLYLEIEQKLVNNKMNYIFLDEVQQINQFQKLVDGLFIKKNVDIYITGSNAKMLSGELATMLSGRYIEIEVLPFSFKEFMDNSSKATVTDLRNFLKVGGFPEVVNMFNSKTQKYITDYHKSLYETIIRKDIFYRNKQLSFEQIDKVINFLMDATGSEISFRNISNNLNIGTNNHLTTNTISNYVNRVLDTYLFYQAKRFDIKGKEILKTLPKFYFVDTGLISSILTKPSGIDFGHLLENVIYLELRRRNDKVLVGKLRNSQVDFVVTDKKQNIKYYQVAWQTSDTATLQRELKPFDTINDHNRKFLITMDIDNNPNINGVKKMFAIDWLLDGGIENE